MLTNGNNTMLERLERVEGGLGRVEVRLDRVETRLGRVEIRLDGIESRLGQVETTVNQVETTVNHLETTVNHLETTVNHLVSRVTALDEKVDAQGRRFDVQMEGLRETITTFAENIGGRLDVISEQMTDKQKATDTRFSDDEAVLREHSRRITALERRPRRRT